MGEYAEIQWNHAMRRGHKDPIKPRIGRNPIEDQCPICGKGIRAIAGQIKPSMDAHMKAKHRGEFRALEAQEGGE